MNRKGQLDADLQSVQNPKQSPVSNKQEGTNQMLTYTLFKTQGMLLSATTGRASQMLTYKLFKT